MVPEGAASWRYSWDRYLAALLVLAAIAYLAFSGAGRQMWRDYWAHRHFLAGAQALGRAKVDLAEREFESAARLASPAQNMQATIAFDYLVFHMPDAAAPYARAALPTTSDALLLAALGNEFLQVGRRSDAEPLFDRALRISPNDAEVLNTIGYAYAVAGIQLTRAELLLKRALRLKPEAPHIVDSLGWTYYKMGEFSQAVPLLEQANKGMPGNPEILGHLRLARDALNQAHPNAPGSP